MMSCYYKITEDFHPLSLSCSAAQWEVRTVKSHPVYQKLIIKHFIILSFTIFITDKTGPTGLKAKTFTSRKF